MDGRVGNIIYSNIHGRTFARVYNNASRSNDSEGQVSTKSMWGNLVQLWKVSGRSLRSNFETKLERQSDFNAFMKVNMSLEPAVYLPKNVSQQKGCVLNSLIIADGTLDEIEYTESNGAYLTNILVGDLTIDANTTIAQLSAAIITNNGHLMFQEDDQLTLYKYHQLVRSGTGVPYLKYAYCDFTLNVENEGKVWDVLGRDGFESQNGRLCKRALADGYGYTYVHSRKEKTSDGAKIRTSHARLIVNNSLLDTYTGEEARQRALESWGAKTPDVIVPNADGSSYSYGDLGDDDTPEPTSVTLTVSVSDTCTTLGNIQVGTREAAKTDSVTVESGSSIHVKAIALSGNRFAGWSDGDTNAERDITVTVTKSITANFVED